MSSNTKINNIINNTKKISFGIFMVAVLSASILSISALVSPQNSQAAQASLGGVTADSNLIIGTNDTGNSIELSVCVQATPGPIHLANVSTWFQFDTSKLTPTAGTFLQKGQYGNSNNGYGALKWQEVAGTQNGTLDNYSMSLVYSGDGVTPGVAGLQMSTAKELFGKVSFAKSAGFNGSSAINLVKNIYYSTENSTSPISQTISYVTGDCTSGSIVNVVSSSSSPAISSTATNYSSSQAVISSSNIGTLSSAAIGYSSISSLVTLNPITITLSPNTQVPNIAIPNIAFGVVYPPNNSLATFTFPGSMVAISGVLSNNVFTPNLGQLVPSDALSFYGANSFGSGVLKVGSQVYNIPTNVVKSTYVPTTGGGSIVISLAQSSSQSPSPINTNPQSNLETKGVITSSNGVFKSKLQITDPYVCGVGSYGNVQVAKDFGVENVYYDFYKVGSNVASYSFKLKLNANGDFFLPISNSNNIVTESDYRVVYYALDNQGNKAQGEFTDFVTDNCLNVKSHDTSTKNDYNSVRTGGSDTLMIILSFIALASLLTITTLKRNRQLT